MLPPCLNQLRGRLAGGDGKPIPTATASPLRDRDFDVLFEGGALTQPVEPTLEIFQRRPLDRKGVPAIDEGSQRDLGQAQLIACEVAAAFERVIRYRPGGQRLAARRFNRGSIALLGPGADETEQQGAHRRAGGGEVASPPSLDMCSRRGVFRVEPLAVARRAEITADRV